MNKICAISGSQGCGKTTTIRELHDKHNYTTDSFSTPRFVQAELGYKTLAEVLAQPIEKIKDYQLKILDTKFERDMKNKCMNEGGGVVVVERSFIDIYAFAVEWALNTKDIDFLNWAANEYKQRCVQAYREVDYFTVLLMPLKTFEVDPRRASEATRFSVHGRMMSSMWEDFDTIATREHPDVGNSMMLGFDNLSERVKHIHQDIQGRFFPDGEEAKRIRKEAWAFMFEKNKNEQT